MQLGYYPPINKWSKKRLLTELTPRELMKLHQSTMSTMWRLTGRADGDLVRQLNPKPRWSQRHRYMRKLIDSKLYGTDPGQIKVMTVRGYDISLKTAWPIYELLDCALMTTRSLKTKDKGPSFCVPPMVLDKLPKLNRQVKNVPSVAQQILKHELPSGNTISTCLSRVRDWRTLHSTHCGVNASRSKSASRPKSASTKKGG
tara:strand:+ start:128 stop:730 length:603 start_codon:yes stop_codon:yes gene_type:complete